MTSWLKVSLSVWAGFKLMDALLGPVTEKIWRGIERFSRNATAQMGWA